MIQEGLHYDKKCGCKDCKMTTLLDKPIKAKTLKKKLEEINKNNRPLVNGKNGLYVDYSKPLQNNKPSIELIEKLPFIGNRMFSTIKDIDTKIDYLFQGFKTLSNKHNEIIEKINEHSVRLNLIDEEDYD